MKKLLFIAIVAFSSCYYPAYIGESESTYRSKKQWATTIYAQYTDETIYRTCVRQDAYGNCYFQYYTFRNGICTAVTNSPPIIVENH
jgi:hypothetical protein